MSPRSALLVALAVGIPGTAFAQQFDLADAIGRRNGEPPGQGVPFHYPIQGGPQGAFVEEFFANGGASPCPFVHGVFVPGATASGSTQVALDGVGAPIAVTIPGIGTITSPGTGNDGSPSNDGALQINDPSNLNGNPDYTGSTFHSVLATHACLGVAFDLSQIRADMNWPGPLEFTALAGGSCANVSHAVVVVDASDQATVQFSSLALGGNNFVPVTVSIDSFDKYLCLIGGDNLENTINCKHAYWGDPRLMPPCTTGSVVRYGDGCPTSDGSTPRIEGIGPPCIGLEFTFGCTGQPGTNYWLGIGLSNTSVSGAPLPLDLGIIGTATGCELWMSLDLVFGSGPSVGSFAMNTPVPPLALPMGPGTIGLPLYFQAIVVDPALATPLPIAMSDALAVTLGT